MNGPLGGGQRAARRQGGLERGGCLGWLLGGADKREGRRDGGRGRAPHKTAGRKPPAFPALPKPERTNSQSLRAAVMPQDRRSPPSATQDTNQPPIVRPHSATLSPSAFLVGCCDRSSSPPSQRRNPTAAAAILRTCGRPAVRSARIRTQRVDHPPRDRGSTPRRARAVDPRPYYWPLARPQPRLGLSPGNGAHPVEPALSHPSPFPGDSPSDHPPSIDDQGGGLFIRARQQPIRLAVGPIPPTSGRLAVRPGRRQPTTPQLSTTPQLADHHHRGGSPPTPAVHPQRCSRAMGQRPT